MAMAIVIVWVCPAHLPQVERCHPSWATSQPPLAHSRKRPLLQFENPWVCGQRHNSLVVLPPFPSTQRCPLRLPLHGKIGGSDREEYQCRDFHGGSLKRAGWRVKLEAGEEKEMVVVETPSVKVLFGNGNVINSALLSPRSNPYLFVVRRGPLLWSTRY